MTLLNVPAITIVLNCLLEEARHDKAIAIPSTQLSNP